MANNSAIEWTDATWNPVTGCTRASAGCDNCYAVTMTKRLEAMGQEAKYGGLVNPGKKHFNGVVKCHEADLAIPLRRKKPTTYFVCSMSDLFHESVPFAFIDQVFAVMALATQHTFQVLTKRADRLAEYMRDRDWGDAASAITDKFIRPLERGLYLNGELVPPLPNVWLGTSVENQEQANARIPHLLAAPAAVRFLSCEPLLGPVDLMDQFKRQSTPIGVSGDDVSWGPSINWVIVGGESGPKARPMHPHWARSLRDQCQAAGVAFHFKQWGSYGTIFRSATTQQPVMRQFDDFQHWVNKAGPWMQGTTCLDTGGNVLEIGADFMAARDANRFPVALLHRMNKHDAGRLLDGREHNDLPFDLA